MMNARCAAAVVLSALGLSLAEPARCRARQYRIDSQKDFDALCDARFRPGDAILLKRGGRFRGMLAPQGEGAPGAPITIAAYGSGPLPRIDAGGRRVAGVLLRGPYWEVRELEVTNTDGTAGDQGRLFGIYVLLEGREGVVRHIYIENCFVHDVNGLVAGKGRGGVHVHLGDSDAARIDDLRICNNRIVDVGGVGVGTRSSCGGVAFQGRDWIARNLWTNVRVAGNTIDRTGRNNMILRSCKDAVCEYNVLANSSRADTGHSVFCFDSVGTRIQHNEAYGNVGPGGRDRGGFDADYRCVGTVIQYNYSHDNMWFCGIMKRPNRDVVIRYNISQNDRAGMYFYGFEHEAAAEAIRVYNNTHFVRKGLDVRVFAEDRTPINSRFENNIFFFEGRGRWGRNAAGVNTVLRSNVYFHIDPHPSDDRPIVGDPLLADPGRAGTNIDLRTKQALRGYALRPGSPAAGAGIPIQENGGQDILGTPLAPGPPDVGAVATRDASDRAR